MYSYRYRLDHFLIVLDFVVIISLSRLGVFTRNCSAISTLALLGISFCVRCRGQKTSRVSYLLSRRPFLLVNMSGDRYVAYPERSFAAVLNKTAC